MDILYNLIISSYFIRQHHKITLKKPQFRSFSFAEDPTKKHLPSLLPELAVYLGTVKRGFYPCKPWDFGRKAGIWAGD